MCLKTKKFTRRSAYTSVLYFKISSFEWCPNCFLDPISWIVYTSLNWRISHYSNDIVAKIYILYIYLPCWYRKFVMTTKVPETKGCIRCCVGRNPYNGYKYLCGIMPTSIFLMQWYEPLNKFMLLKVSHLVYILFKNYLKVTKFKLCFFTHSI